MDEDNQQPATDTSPGESPYNPASAAQSDNDQEGSAQPQNPAVMSAEEDSTSQDQPTDKMPEQENGRVAALDGAADFPAGSDTPLESTQLSNGTAPEPNASEAPSDAAHPAPNNPPSLDGVISPSPQPQTLQQPTAPPASRARLPQDRIGILEDRIAEDPRGDTDAYLQLIEEYKRRNKFDDVGKVYDRMLETFPSAAEIWQAFLNMELENENFAAAERIFSRVLMHIQMPSVSLWMTYLNYIRRRYSLTNDPDGQNRKVISEAFEHVLKQVGRDKDAGELWLEYIQFLKSLPGNVPGPSWQDQQKKDTLRAGYRKAICVPHGQVGTLWTEYTRFEQGVDRAKSGPLLQNYSPSFMQARGARVSLERTIQGLNPTTLARLPPALGFEGDEEYMRQVALWKAWIELEISDPLVLKGSPEGDEWKRRVLYVYRQALMPLRFWPEVWFEAVDFCLTNGLEDDADKLSQEGVKANPESCLLAFQRADRVEISTASESTDEDGRVRRGDAVRKPYDDVINALETLIDQVEARESRDIARVQEKHQEQERIKSRSATPARDQDDGDDDERGVFNGRTASVNAQLEAQIQSIKRGSAVQRDVLRKTVSFAWIALMQAMRRVQGQGKPNENERVRGFRGVFKDLTKHKAKLTSDVYVAGALIEHHSFNDPIAARMFDRGFKLFPNDAEFALAYLKFLISTNDSTNARAVFTQTVGRLEQDPALLAQAKPLYAFWHDYECRYGELNLIRALEKRMAELFPADPRLSIFASRFSSQAFDPCAIRPVVSPATQTRPKTLAVSEQAMAPSAVAAAADYSPRPSTSAMTAAFPGSVNSPKRSLEDSDSESQPPRKYARADSPLKGAAGRRLDAAKRTQMRNERSGSTAPESADSLIRTTRAPSSHPLHPNIWNFLRLLPSAQTARAQLPNVPAPQVVLQALQHADLEQVLPNHERLVSSLSEGYNPMAQAQTQAPAMPNPMMGIPQAAHMAGWQQAGMPQQPFQSYGYGQPSPYYQHHHQQ